MEALMVASAIRAALTLLLPSHFYTFPPIAICLVNCNPAAICTP